jgi:uncharacterized repeat protein (TIGR01451 family)
MQPTLTASSWGTLPQKECSRKEKTGDFMTYPQTLNPNWQASAVRRILAVVSVTLSVALILVSSASAGSYKVIHKFTGGADGGQPEDALILDAAGNLYGTTRDGGTHAHGTVFKLTRNADGSWTESVLHAFAGGSDGADPYAGVTLTPSGILYGTTPNGGASSAGTIFKLVPNTDGSWTESVLYSFTGGSDGASPWAGVILDASGSLYGTTTGGGIQGQGVVYRLAHNANGSWTYGTLHSFTGGNDGSYPLEGNLTFDTAGNLYGATGDTSDLLGRCGTDCGTLFELTPGAHGSWNEKVIFRFDGTNLGGQRYPVGSMIFDSDGHLYGVTTGTDVWYGIVFKMTPSATGYWTASVLHEFQGDQDGAYLPGNVVFDKSGNLYGTTFFGRDLDGACCFGQVYELIPRSNGSWTKTALHRFVGGSSDGSHGNSGVTLDNAGNLYGTALNGGPNDEGAVFEILPGTGLNLISTPYPTPPVQGGSLTYAFKVWNQSSVNATHEVLTTQVPAGTTFSSIALSGTAGLGSCTTPTVGTSGSVVCKENSAMRPNSTWTIRLTVQITAPVGTVITEGATASSDNLGSNTATSHNTVH